MIRGLIAILFITCVHANAIDQQGRLKLSINDGWSFRKGSTSEGEWISVTLPHTWNTSDTFDDTPGYYRGDGTAEEVSGFLLSNFNTENIFFTSRQSINERLFLLMRKRLVSIG